MASKNFNIHVHPTLINGEVALLFNPLAANGMTGSGKKENVQVAATSASDREIIEFLPGYFVQIVVWRAPTYTELDLHGKIPAELLKESSKAFIDQSAIRAAHPLAHAGILQMMKDHGIDVSGVKIPAPVIVTPPAATPTVAAPPVNPNALMTGRKTKAKV